MTLVLLYVAQFAHFCCFVLAARELNRIAKRPDGPKRYQKIWGLLHIFAICSVIGVVALAVVSNCDYLYYWL